MCGVMFDRLSVSLYPPFSRTRSISFSLSLHSYGSSSVADMFIRTHMHLLTIESFVQRGTHDTIKHSHTHTHAHTHIFSALLYLRSGGTMNRRRKINMHEVTIWLETMCQYVCARAMESVYVSNKLDPRVRLVHVCVRLCQCVRARCEVHEK